MTMFVWTSTFLEDMAEGAGSAAIVGVHDGGLAAEAVKFPSFIHQTQVCKENRP